MPRTNKESAGEWKCLFGDESCTKVGGHGDFSSCRVARVIDYGCERPIIGSYVETRSFEVYGEMDKRIEAPSTIDRNQICKEIAGGNRVIVQYSKPTYTSRDLSKLNELCEELGTDVEVRFYGHYGRSFDAAVLQWLPKVQALSVDCLQDIDNPRFLFQLENLRHFSFGVYNWIDPDLLKLMQLGFVERFEVNPTCRSNIDLSPLQNCAGINHVYIAGQTAGLERIGGLPALKILSLSSIPKAKSLGFLSEIQSLQRLSLRLGGRQSISEVWHPSLECLEIVRVRGFNSLGSLESFPSLRELVIEDQIQLAEIVVTSECKCLERIHLLNCKTLRDLRGLKNAVNLKHLRIGRTALSISSLLSEGLPDSLEVFGFYTGKQAENREIRRKLDSLGYAEWNTDYQRS